MISRVKFGCRIIFFLSVFKATTGDTAIIGGDAPRGIIDVLIYRSFSALLRIQHQAGLRRTSAFNKYQVTSVRVPFESDVRREGVRGDDGRLAIFFVQQSKRETSAWLGENGWLLDRLEVIRPADLLRAPLGTSEKSHRRACIYD